MKFNLKLLIRCIKAMANKYKEIPPHILNENKKDISVSLDKILHTNITGFIQSGSKFPILSEEGESKIDFRECEDYFWILDPLDGSLNYSRRIPMYCISLGLWKNRKPIVGIIFDFDRDELYVGVSEKSELCNTTGAWLNEKPVSPSTISHRSKGVICTGFPSWRHYGVKSILKFVEQVRKGKKIRLVGSAALSLAWVACGKVDAYLEEDIRIWDVAAGLALVKAAGGKFRIKPSRRSNFVTAIASNGRIDVSDITKC
jgi:myo-inositol-1(or 4)-monophosphatase